MMAVGLGSGMLARQQKTKLCLSGQTEYHVETQKFRWLVRKKEVQKEAEDCCCNEWTTSKIEKNTKTQICFYLHNQVIADNEQIWNGKGKVSTIDGTKHLYHDLQAHKS